VGFRYAYDAVNDQYVHASGLMILTPSGRISRYFYGIDYAPRDIRLSLVEASGNKTATTTDTVLLYCFRYNPHTGKYSLMVTNIVKAGGALTVLLLGTFIVRNLLRDRRQSLAGVSRPPDRGGGAGTEAGS
jgi:protein SCO1/2